MIHNVLNVTPNELLAMENFERRSFSSERTRRRMQRMQRPQRSSRGRR